jgi:hypothetical protein
MQFLQPGHSQSEGGGEPLSLPDPRSDPDAERAGLAEPLLAGEGDLQ